VRVFALLVLFPSPLFDVVSSRFFVKVLSPCVSRLTAATFCGSTLSVLLLFEPLIGLAFFRHAVPHRRKPFCHDPWILFAFRAPL